MAEGTALVNNQAFDFTSTYRRISHAHETPVEPVQQRLENATLSSTDEPETVEPEQIEEGNDEDQGVYEVESLCMNCHDDVRLLTISYSLLADLKS
jgi:hypothetical protein